MAAQNPKKKPKNSAKSKIAVAPTVAPGQALGFFLQETLLTHRLLSAQAGEFLSLELLEDVAVHQGGAHHELIQTTSTAGNNPVADRHPKLWKTLYNWIATVQELKLDPTRTHFALYVSSPATGPLVSAFNGATTPSAVQAALDAARNELWGPGPLFPKRATLPLPLAKFANAVLSTADEVLVPVITNFELKFGSGSPHEDFLGSLEQQISLEATDIPAVSKQMLGWVKQKLEMSLEKQQPAMVSRDEFFNEMRAFIRKTAFRQILQSFAADPSPAEKEKERLKTYVRQLELIELDDTRILAAITDYLMSATERVEWAERGLVHSSSFDQLDKTLREAWSNHGLIAEATHPGDAVLPRGRSLYANCMNHPASVQGMSPPSYFVPGCFHRLADNEDIGWHPHFKSLLSPHKK